MSAISSQPSHVFRPAELAHKDRGGGARTIPLVTAARGATSYLNGVTIFEPGAQIAHHTHNVAESVMVIAGDAIVDIDGDRTVLHAFDTTFVPANVPHHFENAVDDAEMRIFWTYGSLDATRTIMANGETGRVDAESTSAVGDAIKLVYESALITVLPRHESAFAEAVRLAVPLFQLAHGARTLSLERSEEDPLRFRLVVGWESVEDHLEGFRSSAAFSRWRELIGDHVDGPPVVEHFREVMTGF